MGALSALVSAGISAGASLLGGLFGDRAKKKAASQQYLYQASLDNGAAAHQREFQNTQNNAVRELNHAVRDYNRDVLDNHSTTDRTTTTTSDDQVSHTGTNRQRDTTSTTGSIDFKRLVNDAEAAGFNPLTVLRAGGLAGYQTSNTLFTSDSINDFTGRTTSRNTVHETGKVARDTMTYFGFGEIPQAHQPGAAPVVQASNPIGDAINAGLTAYNNYDPHAERRRALEFGLAQAQLDNLQSDTNLNKYRLNPPSYTGRPQVGTSGGFQGAQKAPQSVLGRPVTPEVGKTEQTNPYLGGAHTDPTINNVATFAERYGEPGEYVAFPFVFTADIAHNLNRVTNNSGLKAGQAIKNAANTGGNYVMDATDGALDYLKRLYAAQAAAWQ